MNPAAFTAWLNAIAAADTVLAGLIDLGRSVRADLSTADQATLDASIRALQSRNDADFDRVNSKLQDAQAR
jgi:hypothetical protein